jgi:hypothetical protein
MAVYNINGRYEMSKKHCFLITAFCMFAGEWSLPGATPENSRTDCCFLDVA